MSREAFTWLEIDVDGCDLTFGVGACPAALGGGVERKCYNLYDTCPVKNSFVHKKVFRTLRYCQPRSGLPKGQTWYPVMQGSPSEYSATVNIAGSDSNLSAFGRRATVSVTLNDFLDHERYWDPYQAERVSGAAQADGIGYNPYDRGTHFGKLKRRWPYFATRAMRICNGYLVNGVITDQTTRHYIITGMEGPSSNGAISIKGEDVLNLADSNRTRVPAASNGKLAADITDFATTLVLTPAGVGDAEYPASGRARIGSELVDYTRSVDTITLTARGVNKTAAAAHKLGDTFQVVKRYVSERIDDVVADQLLSAGVDPSMLPLADWAAEVDRWLPSALITSDIAEPTGIKANMSTMVPIGFSLFWDSAAQKIRLKANRPVDGDVVWKINDRDSILEVSLEEDDKQRAALVLFWTVRKDPTKSSSSSDNYDRTWASGDPSAYEAWRYNGGAVKEFFCQWFDNGNDAIVRIAGERLLDRFATTPKFATILLDAVQYKGIALTDVVELETFGLQDATGLPLVERYQVIERSEPKAGEKIRVVVQRYQFDGRFAFATANDVPNYSLATPAQRDPGFFACDPITLRMPDGSPPYEAI